MSLYIIFSFFISIIMISASDQNRFEGPVFHRRNNVRKIADNVLPEITITRDDETAVNLPDKISQPEKAFIIDPKTRTIRCNIFALDSNLRNLISKHSPEDGALFIYRLVLESTKELRDDYIDLRGITTTKIAESLLEIWEKLDQVKIQCDEYTQYAKFTHFECEKRQDPKSSTEYSKIKLRIYEHYPVRYFCCFTSHKRKEKPFFSLTLVFPNCAVNYE